MDEINRRQTIEFDRSFSIGTQDATYDYNVEFWDSIWTLLLMYLTGMFNIYWNHQLSNKIRWCVYSRKGIICSYL